MYRKILPWTLAIIFACLVVELWGNWFGISQLGLFAFFLYDWSKNE